MHSPRPSGYTLIEILMVVVLVAVVSAVALPRFIDFRSDAKAAVTKDRMLSIQQAIIGAPGSGRTGYFSHMGRMPASLNELVVQGTQANFDPINKLGWNGPYLNSSVSGWNQDAWGNAYQYTAGTTLGTSTLRSCGPDGSCGNADDISITF